MMSSQGVKMFRQPTSYNNPQSLKKLKTQESNRLAFNSMLFIAVLSIAATSDPENKLIATLALGATMLAAYFANKYPEYIPPIFDENDFFNKKTALRF